MKKVLLPLLLFLALIVLLAGAISWYEKYWGADGPFHSDHHH
jgi:hypothetical protein